MFVKQGSLYAFKGLSGRLGPIGVHAALLLILFGTALSGFAGYHGSAMCPEGGEFIVGDFMAPSSALSLRPSGAGATVRVNSFSIDYRWAVGCGRALWAGAVGGAVGAAGGREGAALGSTAQCRGLVQDR